MVKLMVIALIWLAVVSVDVDGRRGRRQLPLDYPDLSDSSSFLSSFLPVDQRDHTAATRSQIHRCQKARIHKGLQCQGLQNEMQHSMPGIHLHFDRGHHKRRGAGFVEFTNGNYTSDGFLPTRGVYTFWQPAEWSNQRLFHYKPHDGAVRVRQDGLYLVYAQVQFSLATMPESVSPTAYGINIKKMVGQGEYVEEIASVVYRNRGPVVPAYTATVTKLIEGTHVYIEAAYLARKVAGVPRKTFWGIVKISD